MSKKKTNKIEIKHGGKRARAGHPKTGITKVKICISVTATIWQDALTQWNGKGSQLVDRLLERFVARKVMP